LNLEYVIVKLWRRKDSENVQASNKMAPHLDVTTDKVKSQCFYVKMRQIFG